MAAAVRRFAAGIALTAIFACSGLGLCWQQFGTRGHDCCAADEAQLSTPAKACASFVTTVLVLKVAPPHAPSGHLTTIGALASALPTLVPGPLLPAKAPPLVLRI
jgi:hypothetical protein